MPGIGFPLGESSGRVRLHSRASVHVGLAAAAALLAAAAPAPAADLVLHPTQDARVKSTSATSNYGTDAELRTRFGSSDGIHYRSYLQFAVAGLARAPQSARLRLYATDGSNDGGSLYTVATSFDERKITWQGAPSCGGTPVALAGAVTAGAWVELDVTSAIHGDGVYAFCLASASSDSALYSSREGAKPPDLVIAPAAPGGCSSNAACSDGKLCNGAELCVAGACVAGTPPSCDDAIACTADACDAAANACIHAPSHASCDDGFFCNGVETCDLAAGCRAGATAPCAGAVCDEAFDACTQPEPPTAAEVRSGRATQASAVFTEANLAAVAGDLYLAAVSTKPQAAVTGVSGLGLAWSPVAAQCGGRNQTGIALWSAQGVPTGPGPVTATLSKLAAAAVISVTRYADAAPNGIGNVAIANSNGPAGPCAGGIDTTSWMTTLDVETEGSAAYAAVALRQRTHTPAGFVERAEVHGGAGGDTAGLAAGDAQDAPAGTQILGGSFNGTLDWAAVVAEILPADGGAPSAALPPVPVPAENPITEAKRVLGKALFWDEQLSSDDSVACGTCHQPLAGSADPRLATHPGPDASFGTDDDVLGSAGVVRRNASGQPVSDPLFGFAPQVTRRSAPVAIGALFARELFVDGAARGAFVDPQTGQTAIAAGGALESQAVLPPLDSVEMSHPGRDWAAVAAKLAAAPPLARASNLPADLAAAIAARPSYGQLFQAAFGDSAITARRIAFAIATYERTLVADQTPWDRFMAGDAAALTARQQEGWEAFRVSLCATCHMPPLFTDDAFHNIGVRPVAEDIGRQRVTGLAEDRGKFRTPTLRNAGLKRHFMHNGRLASVNEAVAFYLDNRSLQFAENRDPLMPLVDIPPDLELSVDDFIRNGLVDPRVRDQAFPFDRPTLSAP